MSMDPKDFWMRFADMRLRLEQTWARTRAVLSKSETVLARCRQRRDDETDLVRAGAKPSVAGNESARVH